MFSSHLSGILFNLHQVCDEMNGMLEASQSTCRGLVKMEGNMAVLR